MRERSQDTRDSLFARVYRVAFFFGVAVILANGVSLWVLIPYFFLFVAIHSGWQAMLSRRSAPTAEQLASGIVLGEDQRRNPALLSYTQLAAHGLILGATGSGKSTSLLKILCEAIVRGQPVVAIDLKGSRLFGDTLYVASRQARRSFQAWLLDGALHWNPLKYGDATELKDKLISAERFTEPHYQRAAERYVQTAIQILQQARPDKPVTLAAVVALLDPNNLKSMLPHIPKEMMTRVGPYLSALNRDQRSAVLGLQSRLAVLSESSTGALLQPGESGNEIDLHRALCGGNEVALFSLNSSRNPKLAAQVASLVIQDLIAVAGYRQNQPSRPLALIAIDEFSALDADNLLGLMARARDAGISVLLSTQELADLERLARGFKDQVLGNTAVTVAHRQNVPDSAELIARMIGTDTVWQHTYQTGHPGTLGRLLGQRERTTGLGTKRQVEEFRIHPNVIKELPTGTAVLISKLPTASAQLVRIVPWTPTAHADGS